ncbi:MAG TPA: substrate-binding domain-containing protein [Bacteroidota bacterium]|nr:substrate-binding domain-containing protein [Bacteroidota bacterium]
MRRLLIPALVLAVLLPVLLFEGCPGKEPGSASLTKGSFRLGVDEAVLPVMQHEIREFTSQYTEAQVTVHDAEAREIIAQFAADSIRTIVCARELNREERGALGAAKVSVQEYLVARSAVAVIAHRSVPLGRLRVGQLDTIFSGTITRWPGGSGMMIELAVCGLNSSVNEVFRKSILKSGGFDPAAKSFHAGADLLAYVGATRGAIGILALNWLGSAEGGVTVIPVASSAMRPDSTYAPGEYYSPHPAYIFQGYYPVIAPVYVYTRNIEQDLSMGFIAFLTSVAGQKVFQNDGLVPATMPVRLVHLTSQQVN